MREVLVRIEASAGLERPARIRRREEKPESERAAEGTWRRLGRLGRSQEKGAEVEGASEVAAVRQAGITISSAPRATKSCDW